MLVHFDRSILNPLCCVIHFFFFFFVWVFHGLHDHLWVCLCMASDIPSRSHMMMMMSRSDLQGRETNFTVHCSQCSWHMIASWWKRSIFSLQWFLYWASLYYIVYIYIYWAISSAAAAMIFDIWLMNICVVIIIPG